MYFKKTHNTLRSKRVKQLAFCLSIAGISAASSLTLAESNRPPAELKIKPKRCVALHQGQTCYQKITLSWKQPAPTPICLVDTTRNKKLRCWQDKYEGTIKFSWQGDKATTFNLINQNKEVVSSAQIDIAWVYKKKRKRSETWRLF